MVTEQLWGEDLLELQREKGNPCLSVIIPTHRLAPARFMDHTIVKKMREQAKNLVTAEYGLKQAEVFMDKMDALIDTIDYDHNQDGLGFFISANVQQLVSFPFPVEAKITADDSFEIRNLLYKVNFGSPYYALVLTEKGARYFEGRWNTITEIRDKNFPEKHIDDYEYTAPARSTSYAGHAHEKSVEKDKSILDEIRLKSFFHQVDQKLSDYLMGNIPMIVFGTKERLGHFADVTRHAKHMAGTITGSYGMATEAQLAELAWPVMKAHLENAKKQSILDFENQIGARKGLSGLQSVWSAAVEGRGNLLLVEKDYSCPGYTTEAYERLFLKKPEVPHKVVTDAVDDLIEMVLEKNGQVQLVENGMLTAYDRVALVTRY